MQAPELTYSRFCLLIVSILLLFNQGCALKLPTEVKTVASDTPTAVVQTSIPPTTTASPLPPTATLISQFTTLPPPTPPPLEYEQPSQFLTRLTYGGIEAFAVSPQADKLVVASASHICMFATDTYEQIWCNLTVPPIRMTAPEGALYYRKVSLLTFRPDGQELAMILWNGYVLLFDPVSGERNKVIRTNRTSIKDLAWTKDGKQIMVASRDGGIEMWEISSTAYIKPVDIDLDNYSNISLSADGSVFATSNQDGIITLWDTATFTPTGTIDIQTPGWVNRMVWSPDNTHLYAAIATPMPCEELCDPNDPEYKGWIAGWAVPEGYLAIKARVSDIITSLAVSPDGEYLAAGGEFRGSFVVLSLHTERLQVRLPDTNAHLDVGWLDSNHALYLPDPKHVDAMSISEWDVPRSEHHEVSLPGFETIYSAAWLPEGERLITNSAGGKLSIWQARTGQRLEQFELSFDSLPLTEFQPAWMSPTEPLLAVVINGRLALVDLEKRQVAQWIDHQDIAPEIWITRLVWSMDGKLLGAELSGNRMVAVWDAHTGERLFTLEKNYEVEINGMAFSPNGKLLAMSQWIRSTTDDNGNYVPLDHSRLVIISFDTGEEVNSLDLEASAHDLFWLNQDQIAYDHCENMHVWDLVNNSDSEMPGSQPYSAVRLDGNLAAIPCFGVGIRLWSTNTGQEVACLEIQPDKFGYRSLAFSPPGTLLSSLSDNGSLLVWDVSEYSVP